MNTTGKLKIAILSAFLLLACGTADAQPGRWRWHWHPRPFRTAIVVSRPAVTTHVSNRFSSRERLKMAVAYLKNNEYLTVKKYAQITNLPKAAAEAELDAFVMDRDKPIIAVTRGKKRVYVLKQTRR